MVMGMGFTREEATKALRATDNHLERSVDWIFSHQGAMDTSEAEDEPGHPEEIFRDGNHRACFYFLISAPLFEFDNELFIVFRIQASGIYIAYGNIDHGGALRVSSFEK